MTGDPTNQDANGGESEAACATVVPITGIAVGGDGVGRESSGRVLFAPRSAPGDLVRVEVVESRKRWARGRVREVLEAGPGRRSAPCPIYDLCGGCQLQHLNRSEQLAAKRDLVGQALRRLGGIEIPVPEPIVRGGEFGYRNRVTFATGHREGRMARGLRALEAPGAIVDVRVCMLAEAPIVEAWTALRDAWTKEPGWAPGPGTRITVRASASGNVDVMTRGETPIPAADAAHLVDTVPGLTGWHHAPVSGDPECVAGAGWLVDRWQGRDFELPAGVFLQVNREVSSAMDEWIDERVGPLEGRRVLDLYAGVGARAIRWSEQGADVVACEVSSAASAACRTAAGVTGRLEVVTDRVERQVESLMPADLVVVNPPRAGLSRTVADRLAVASAEELVYVSCDPATLARDLKRLGGGWSIREVQPFDAFPQTSHVETIVWMCRTRGNGVGEHE